MLDYAADPDVPLLWRFRRSLAGGGIAIDTGYHLVDCLRFLVGEIAEVQGLTSTSSRNGRSRQPTRSATGEAAPAPAARARKPVDVEDAAAALLSFSNGAYGVLETSRVTIGRRIALRLEVFGSLGSAAWDLERPDEFHVCLPGDPSTFGYRRVLVSPAHPGATELLIAGTDGTSIGCLGQECAMWAEFLAIAEGRPAHADFEDGVRANAVIDALYAAARSGERTAVGADEVGRRAAWPRQRRDAARQTLEERAHEARGLLHRGLRGQPRVLVLDGEHVVVADLPQRRHERRPESGPWTLPTVRKTQARFGRVIEGALVEDAGDARPGRARAPCPSSARDRRPGRARG